MRELIHRLASLKIAIGALAAIVVVLAFGTIIDSAKGYEVAARAVYHALWFRLLLGVFVVSVGCSLIDEWPWGWRRAGFALTHGSMLLVLAGALVTDLLKVEGRMTIWEGDETSLFESTDRAGATVSHRLPFTLRLDSFEIDTYPGTRRPAMFRSRVVVSDPATLRRLPASIEMNNELAYGGYRFFQSSYRQTDARDMTVLTVSRDPGQPIVFTGYGLLMLGMVTVLATRIGQRRAAGAPRPASTSTSTSTSKRRSLPRVAALGLAALAASLVSGSGGAEAASLPDPARVKELAGMPVQHDGRVMPLDTVAREAVWQVTGRRAWNRIDPVAMVLGWTFDPEGWASEPIVKIRPELASAWGLTPGARAASFAGIVGSAEAMKMFEQARADQQADRPLSRLQAEAQKVEGRLIWMQRFFDRSILAVVPARDPARGDWMAPEHLHEAAELAALIGPAREGAAHAGALIDRELAYNSVRPSRVSWWILTAATLLSILAWNVRRRWLDAAALAGLVAGFGVMTWGLAARWQVGGRIPASNMYESLLFLGWGVGLFALVALVFLRNRMVVLNAAAMSALTMALTDLLPVDPFIHPVPPVLAGTPWLAIHVPIIMVSYSVLALGVLVAHMQIGFEVFAPGRRDLSDRMSDLLYWYIHVGSILLIAGILTGSIWAASSWGRYWGWDPKEVWSLIAFLAYLAILHGRLDKVIGRFGVAALSIVAFWTILMTYLGVNFVLTTGLHSYGFGGSGVVLWMGLVAALEAVFLGAGWIACRSRAQRGFSRPRPA